MDEQLLRSQKEGGKLLSISTPTTPGNTTIHLPHFLRIVNVDIIGPGSLPKVI